jgi:acyl transferase domain-containing protein
MGEVTAAVVAGALSPAEGLTVIATRSSLMARLSGRGAMALLELDAAGAEALVAEYPEVTVSVYASPRQTVVAGPPEQVDAVVAVVDGRDLLARRVEVDVASHSAIIDPILGELREALAGLAPGVPRTPLISTVGHDDGQGPAFGADYWAANLRNPVRFHQAIEAAGAEHGTFVEVSPHPVLTYAIGDTLGQVHHHAIGTLARDTHDTVTFHTNLNATHTTSPPETPHPPEPHPVIPTTPWHHTHHWHTPRTVPAVRARNGAAAAATAVGDEVPDDWFYGLAWPTRELTARGADGPETGSWLVLGDAELGAELGRVAGGGARIAVRLVGARRRRDPAAGCQRRPGGCRASCLRAVGAARLR